MNRFIKKAQKGFTLIEILVVIGIIAILAAVVIIAINPARQFAQARNSQRQSNIETILNGIGQDLADNKGVFGGPCAVALPTASTSIITGAGGTLPTGLPAATVDLSCLSPTYVPNFPSDPSINNGGYTGYEIKLDSIGRVMVCAHAAAETAIPGSTALCVTR
jgi:prepilin-type N-terminal cleavage/methylation domain-containing protein